LNGFRDSLEELVAKTAMRMTFNSIEWIHGELSIFVAFGDLVAFNSIEWIPKSKVFILPLSFLLLLSIPLNGFGATCEGLGVPVCEPFNSIEWILVSRCTTENTVIALSIPLNGF